MQGTGRWGGLGEGRGQARPERVLSTERTERNKSKLSEPLWNTQKGRRKTLSATRSDATSRWSRCSAPVWPLCGAVRSLPKTRRKKHPHVRHLMLHPWFNWAGLPPGRPSGLIVRYCSPLAGGGGKDFFLLSQKCSWLIIWLPLLWQAVTSWPPDGGPEVQITTASQPCHQISNI